MASRKAQKAMMRELKRITDSIPTELIKNLMKKEIIAPTAKALFGKALEDPSISDEQRERFQLMLDSGVLDREVEVVDFDTEKAIDAYITAELALAVKAGRLPKEAPEWDYLKRKGKKYARKQQKRLEEVFRAAQDSGDDASGDDREHAVADSERGDQREGDRGDGVDGTGQAEAGEAQPEEATAS